MSSLISSEVHDRELEKQNVKKYVSLAWKPQNCLQNLQQLNFTCSHITSSYIIMQCVISGGISDISDMMWEQSNWAWLTQNVQWNLQIKDTIEPAALSFVLSWRLKIYSCYENRAYRTVSFLERLSFSGRVLCWSFHALYGLHWHPLDTQVWQCTGNSKLSCCVDHHGITLI